MFRRSVPILRPGLILCLCLSLFAMDAAGAALQSHRAAVAQVNGLMRQNRRTEALPLCRQYAADYPADAQMLYNLACLENTVGDQSRAEPAYLAALQAGFDAFDVAATDPDLQGDLHNVIEALNEAEQARLAAQSAVQAMTLDLGTWSEPHELIPHGPYAAASAPPVSAPTLRLKWRETGLELEVTAGPAWAAGLTTPKVAPWQGGPALFLSLCLPDGSSDWESSNHFLFAFGAGSKGGTGGMFVSSRGHWQPVTELAPKIKPVATDQIQLTASIPWTALMPYDPVVDTPLGINASLVIPAGPLRRWASLVETTDTMNPLAQKRRYAPLTLNTDSIDSDQFAGKLKDSLSRDKPLDLDLVAVSKVPGEAMLSLNFMDQAGRSVLPNGPITGKFTLNQGTNKLHRQADFRSLKAGGYLLQAKLTFPSGREQAWGATVLHLPPDWQNTYQEHAAMVALNEQATVNYLLDTVTKAVANHQPRRNPGPIVTTLLELDQMLAAAEENGTILPDKGGVVVVYPGPDGHDRLCRLYLPAGREHADGLNPILILGYGYGQEDRLAARIGRNYEFGDQKPTLKSGKDTLFPIYLVPELRPDRNNQKASLVAEAAACQRWAEGYFGTPAVSLVGIDGVSATTLSLAKQAPATARALLVFAGAGLAPWPQAQPDFIRQQLGPPASALPITWVDFLMETDNEGQALDILRALEDLGYNIAAKQEVRGSMDLTQVADRVVHWAEGLR